MTHAEISPGFKRKISEAGLSLFAPHHMPGPVSIPTRRRDFAPIAHICTGRISGLHHFCFLSQGWGRTRLGSGRESHVRRNKCVTDRAPRPMLPISHYCPVLGAVLTPGTASRLAIPRFPQPKSKDFGCYSRNCEQSTTCCGFSLTCTIDSGIFPSAAFLNGL